MTERVMAYISKYALTAGIQHIEVKCGNSEDIARGTGNNDLAFYHKGEWHRTREEAVVRAEEMRKRKIESVKRSLKKLEDMKF